MNKAPAFQFYPGDWQRDAALRACSVAARGCWIEMICIMHQADPYGHLTLNGKAIAPDVLARMIGATRKEVDRWLHELEEAGVFQRLENGCIKSRRMVQDEAIRRARAEGGKLGGNPALKEGGKVNLSSNLPPNLPPTPSSSSSSSSSKTLSPGLKKSKHSKSEEFLEAWELWKKKVLSNYQRELDEATEQAQLYSIEGKSTEEAIDIVRFSCSRSKCHNLITDGSHREKPNTAAAPRVRRGPNDWSMEELGIGPDPKGEPQL